jgi:hypothetical protein
MTGGPFRVTASDHIQADNSILHDEVLAAFAEIFQGKLRIPLPAI